ncbi:hypothetical protein ACVW1C_001705 [Bradyrhizobium sp. USDA 4011]
MISEYWKYTPDLPDASSGPVDGRQPPVPLHGVVFDILPAQLRRLCKQAMWDHRRKRLKVALSHR